MKKAALIILAFCSAAVFCNAKTLWVYESDGTRTAVESAKIDSISFVTPGNLALSPEEKTLDKEGGTFNLYIYADMAWEATVSSIYNIMLSQSKGTGNATIQVSTVPNYGDTPITETVTIRLKDGYTQTLTITVTPY